MDSGTLGRISMRSRMTALIGFAMLPLFVLLGVAVIADYDLTLNSARREVLQSSALAASRQSQVFSTSRVVLDTVRRSVGALIDGGGDCRQLLAKVRSANPQFISVGVTDETGMIVCHSTMTIRDNFRDLDFINRIMASDGPDFVVSDYLVMRALNKPTVTVGIPMIDENGRRTGVVFAGLDLDYLAAEGASLSEGGQRVVAIVQPSSGRVLTYYPKGQFDQGATFGDHPLVKAMRQAPAGGVTEAPGFFGTDRIFGFEPIDGAETAGLMVAVGESRSALLAPINAQAFRSLVGGSTGLMLALLASWWLVDKLQLQPVRRLTWTARRIGAGDFDVSSGIDAWQSPELRELGTALDKMAARLASGRAAERAVAASEAQYRLLAENTADLVTCLDTNGHRVFASPASMEMLGLTPEEMVGGRPMDLVHPDDRHVFDPMMARLRAGQPVTGIQHRYKHALGHYIWVEVSGRPTDDGKIVFAIRDVTERRRIEDDLAEANRQLATLALTDSLTELFNRRAFDETLERAFEFSLAEGADLSLLMIDVDRFKTFNDRYGHTVGDECLRKIAAAFRAMLRRPGIAVARYGGEEFAVILPETSLSSALQEAEALRCAVRGLGIANASSEHGIVTVSIGVATLVRGKGLDTALELVRRADGALYDAKARGRDRTEIGMMALTSVS